MKKSLLILSMVILFSSCCEENKENKIIDITYVVYYPNIQDTVRKSYVCDSSMFIYTDTHNGVNTIKLGKQNDKQKIYQSSAPFKIIELSERPNIKKAKNGIKEGETIEYSTR